MVFLRLHLITTYKIHPAYCRRYLMRIVPIRIRIQKLDLRHFNISYRK